MKATMMIKPLVFAIAAAMATTAMAGRTGGHDPRDDEEPEVTQDTIQTTWFSGAHANISNEQTIRNSEVNNEATENTARATDSANGSAGNLGVNVAAGDVNQQANEAALATADESFIFGHAVASIDVTQRNGNTVSNYSTQNRASITNMGNGSSGNIGINVTAGNFNQQKNAMAAAVSGGRHVSASAGATQTVGGADVDNSAQLDAEYAPVVLGVGLAGGYLGGGVGVIADEEPSTITEGNDNDRRMSGGGNDDVSTVNSEPDKDVFGFVEAGGILLGGVAAGWVPVGATVTQPVVNNATLSNSLNGASGNIGANVSAGTHNQQVNSLSIAAGCNACPK